MTDSSPKPSPGKIQAGSVIAKSKKDATSSRASNTRTAKSAPSDCPSSTEDASIFVDLAYVPSGAASPTVGVDFFKSVRSSCYVVSGDCPEREKLMRQTLDALLHAKTGWEHATQVRTPTCCTSYKIRYMPPNIRISIDLFSKKI